MEEKTENNVNEKVKTDVKKNNKKTTRIVIVLCAIVFVALVAFVNFRGSYLEISEIGEQYLSIFWKNANMLLKTFTINFICLFLIIFVVNLRIKSGLKPFFEEEKKEMPKLMNKSIAFVGAAIISLVTSKIIMDNGISFFNAATFGKLDSIFGLDISFFMFQKPFIELILQYGLLLSVGMIIYTVFYYIFVFNKFFDGVNRETVKNSKLIKQVLSGLKIATIILAGIILMRTFNIGNEKFITIKGQEKYSLYGAGLSDLSIKLWGYRIATFAVIFAVFRGVKYFKKESAKQVLVSVLIVPAYLVGLLVVLIAFQLVYVTPNELDKEKIFISRNIENTKEAYNIDIEEISMQEGGKTVTEEQINHNSNIVNNITIVNKDTVLSELNSSLTSKKYYSYLDSQIQLYNIDGKDRLVYVTPREILSSTKSRTYNNKTYEYTHGYGTILTSATTVDEKGNLENIQKGFSTDDEVLKINQPRIYFGMLTNDTAVTNSKSNQEFDYPVLDSTIAENTSYNYDGEAGQKLNFGDRLILSIKEGNIKLALTNNIDKNSKILTNRNVLERAKTVMPYLVYDENPYMVVSDEGDLVWVIDGYTTSNAYPYSQKSIITIDGEKREFNYIRNSVKVLVDAYDGTVKFYITDSTDMIAQTYRNAYPELFAAKEDKIPEAVSNHFVYPELLYKIQADVLQRYHSVQADVLYRNDDVWEIASSTTKTKNSKFSKDGKAMQDIETFSTMVKQDGEDRLGKVMLYTLEDKQNIISYLVGTTEKDKQTLKVYKFSEDTNILGPTQVNAQLTQDESIAAEIGTLNVAGTKITKNIAAVPVDNTLVYVVTFYQQNLNEADALPTLKKVIVASGNKMAIGNDIESALKKLVSQYAYDIEFESTDTVNDLISAIIKANANLQKSTQDGDWEMMGKDMQKLQLLIEKLKTVYEKENVEKDNQSFLDSLFNREEDTLNENIENNIIENNETVVNKLNNEEDISNKVQRLNEVLTTR